MDPNSVVHSTFVLERSYAKPPETVFSAFSDAGKKRRWYADGRSHETELFEMDFRPGGMERFRYRFKEGSPFPGVALTSEGSFQDIVANRRIVEASTMMLGDRNISSALITFEFLPTKTGTDLICTHQGVFFEGSGGPEMREAGWKSLFEALAVVLAEVADHLDDMAEDIDELAQDLAGS